MYGAVCRAREKESGKVFALKKIKMERETDGFPLTSIREINILLALHHKNIVNVTEVGAFPLQARPLYQCTKTSTGILSVKYRFM